MRNFHFDFRGIFPNYVRGNSLYQWEQAACNFLFNMFWNGYFLLLICSHSHKQCLTILHTASPRFGDFFMSIDMVHFLFLPFDLFSIGNVFY